MLHTVWAVVHNGKIEPIEEITFPEGAKVIVTVLPEEDDPHFWMSASEKSLDEVWANSKDDIYAKLLQK